MWSARFDRALQSTVQENVERPSWLQENVETAAKHFYLRVMLINLSKADLRKKIALGPMSSIDSVKYGSGPFPSGLPGILWYMQTAVLQTQHADLS